MPHNDKLYTIENNHVTCPPRIGPAIMLKEGLEKGGMQMARRSYTLERIIKKLREVELLRSQESTIGEAARKIGATE